MKTIYFLVSIFFVSSAFAQDVHHFTIKGKVTGFEDGTKVSFYNRQQNKLDSLTVMKNNSFEIVTDRLAQPDFRFLVFDEKDPAIPLLIDNSDLLISGSKENLNHLTITGSRLQDEYLQLSNELSTYEQAFQSQNFSPEIIDSITAICQKFITDHPSSFASLLAVSQIMQTTGDVGVADAAFKQVDNTLQESELGKALAYQINLAKSTAIGSHIMPFTQNDVNGKPVNINDFKGKYVLIDFWASWCRPCRMENPNVVANYNRFKDKNFTVLGVSLDQSKPSWLSAIKMDKLTWTHVSDLKGWQNEVSSMFHITSIPQNILIDPNGVIIAKNVRGADLGNTLEKVLNKQN